MKLWPILFLLFAVSFANAQSTIYQEFETDSAAEPRGGMPYMATFLQANLRKPLAAEAKGIGGRVIVNGIVEPDGTISNVKIINSFRPDCDREAARVFSLFNAWKPAYKGGKPVRQQVNIPITFKPNPPFMYENGARISYFDSEDKLLTDSTKARYKQIMPIDSAGIPTGDIVLYKAKGNAWKEERRIPLVQKPNSIPGASGKTGYLIGYQNGIIQWDGLLISVDDKGALLRQAYFQNGRRSGTELNYHPNGAVSEKIEEYEEKYVATAWYSNGQVQQIRAIAKPKPTESLTPDHVLSFWDSTGHQLVKDGNGRAIYRRDTRSYADTTKRTTYIEQGSYVNGFKQGVWQGRYADGSYSYEEEYDKGISRSGKALSAEGNVLYYTVVEKQPEFKGGMQALGQFLSSTLHYPPDAQRAKVQGRVFISFVIDTDGSVVDAQVLKGIGFGTDQEALRVVKATSGKWNPGMQRGQAVRVKYNLPINFTLN
ncbi:TonB family protein [Spirosoma sp. KCTC 42546]|uniref:TonB family protein n=1 Tax=Spirosoma sp. KCTC 42546 TaxID=2520506 RepID=UPI00115716F0|nr:TonB family protein [Spirosoma sp. KCTC 42546]QDK78083.1 TonB family protein [Spirosoma sp. KCTC 42546]